MSFINGPSDAVSAVQRRNFNYLVSPVALAPAPTLRTSSTIQLGFATSWVINAPVNRAAGDLLILVVNTYAGGQFPATITAGWTRIATATDGGNSIYGAVFVKVAANTAADTITVTTGSNTWGSYVYFVVSGASAITDVETASLTAAATTATVSFPLLTPTGGNINRLYLEAFAWHGTAGITANAASAGYSGLIQSAPVGNTNQTASAGASKTAQSSSEQPGNVTLSAPKTSSQSWTISVQA